MQASGLFFSKSLKFWTHHLGVRAHVHLCTPGPENAAPRDGLRGAALAPRLRSDAGQSARLVLEQVTKVVVRPPDGASIADRSLPMTLLPGSHAVD